ncbi:zinc metallopeptidase [Peptoniphilus equinus]|uniref:Zinc metallopeptidase n=1 Tax=Peptoniphilus equinus TaxID=3016343 RepID=A0ABY7QRD2_9FIRM|nr:neutral zinc metallopeptidase [Peptoniphilus equinus]WBW49332.1 zinc metallopeptidase [Peptoniphilus equinus]
MKWRGRRASGNVTTGSGSRRGGMLPVGGGIGFIILLLLSFLMGRNPLDLMSGGTQGPPQQAQQAQLDERGQFLSVVLADTEDVWTKIFNEHGAEYQKPTLHLYEGGVQSACGYASSDMGPFYCSGDDVVYIDTTFYDDLKTKYGATGDFALAYVLAHEVGHAVQNRIGTLQQVFALQDQMSETEFNQYMVRLELQADYYAGVYAHFAEAQGYLEPGDIQEAMNAAAAVGDDRIQQQTIGRSIPDSFTHGTSEQRMRWFMKGYEYGTLEDGDTFSATEL